jgi:hypothetical protein
VPPPGVVSPLVLETFDGSGEAVHPDFAIVPVGWGSSSPWQRYLVATPYPGGNAKYENPSYYVGASAAELQPPVGGTNPIVHPVTGGYLSDPDQVYDPVTNEIWLYYRQVTNENQILLVRSSDGVTWDTPRVLFSVPNHLAISPTVVRRAANDWLMWTVNGGSAGCSGASTTVELRRSTDGTTWSAPETATLNNDPGDSPWHIDVSWVADRQEFWAVYNVKTSGSCTTQQLRFATSSDGVHWTQFSHPLLQRGVIPEFADVVYRASLSYEPVSDHVTFWYSGARIVHSEYVWRVATQDMSRATLFAIVNGTLSSQSPTSDMAPPRGDVPGTPLTNETAP